MFRVRSVPRCLVALTLLLATLLAAAATLPTAVGGRLELAALPLQALPLNGEWGFAWQQFVDPRWDQLPTRELAPVPTSWNDVPAAGKTAGPEGWGSYLLLVNCPAGQSLAVEAIGQRTASRLFINGTPVAAHGEPGVTRESTRAAVHNRVPISPEFACPLRLTLHVANFDHRGGGFVRPIFAGPADVLARQRETRVIEASSLLTAYLVTGIVSLIFFAVRPRERVTLAFGLFCLAMAIYTDMIGERLFLRPLAFQPGWTGYMQVEYLSWLAAMALFLSTLRSLFPLEIHRRVVQVVLGMLGLAALAVLVLRPGIYSYVVLPGQAIAVVVCGYLAVAMLRAQRGGRRDARVLLAGMLAIVVTLVIDLFLIDAPGPDRKFSPIAFALFMLSPAVVIARRLSRALNAEERNRALEENARLREDVERMSRHDLKTPLNSILGATRLLRDDSKLGTEQRELVGVLQRAAYRMLEMVNLSLGLFRMETGSYDFRPQAVDLRDVVTRVLVDLQSFAEANAVTLHLHGAGTAPVYVRGEELLCYSIVANLVKNAVEAAGPGRQVSLALHPGDPVKLTVHNPGEVPREIAARFFEKYVSAGKSGGTGLGTYSARLMARVQGGSLEMRTDAAAGTTLTLALAPLQGVAALPVPAAESERPAAHWVRDMPPREVLLVDDDEYTRLVTRRFLPSPPFDVETAVNGLAACEAVVRRWPHYLLLDMEMPVKDGLATVRWMRAYEAAQGRPRCRIVMISGNDDEASAARALAAGADRFLVKPVSREALLSTLRELESAMPVPAQPAEAPLPVTQPMPLESRPAPLGPLRGAPAASPSAADDGVVLVDPEWIEFFPDFVRVQRDTVDAMARALAAGDREDVRFLAHRATGGLATMGMDWAARQSRSVEHDALHAAADELERRIEGLREHLRKVRIASA